MSSSVLEKRSATTDIKDLIEYQNEIKKHLKNVEKKIFFLEQSYLDDTPGGNVIRGWDPEAKPLNKKGIEPRERVFSNSSYHVFQDYKPIQDELAIEAKIIASNNKSTKSATQGEPKKKKKRKPRKDTKSSKVNTAQSYDNEWTGDY